MSKTVHLCHGFKEENYVYFCIILDSAFFKKFFAPFLILYWATSTAHSQLTQKNKKKEKKKYENSIQLSQLRAFFFPIRTS